jgi:hypothetical protein
MAEGMWSIMLRHTIGRMYIYVFTYIYIYIYIYIHIYCIHMHIFTMDGGGHVERHGDIR